MTTTTIDLTNLTLAQGIKLYGTSGIHEIRSISGAGDVDGDGYDDILIGLPYFNGNAGRTILIFGNKANTNIHFSSVDGKGVRINAEGDDDNMGYSVSSAGDVNGDGYDDILIGAPWEDNLAGESYLIFGKESPWFTDTYLSSGTGIIKVRGADGNDKSGNSVSDVGDVNGDGYGDFLISSIYGGCYLIFGKNTGWTDIDLSSLIVSQGIKILVYPFGYVSNAGDVNGDGYDDFLIGVREAHPLGRTYAGESYLIFGKNTTWTDIDLNTLTLPQGIKIQGAANGDQSGNSVDGAGDVNGDGYDDFLISSDFAGSYLIFGKNTGWADIDLSSLSISQGIKIVVEYTSYVSGAGDVNNDGYDDFLISAPNVVEGAAYLIFGKNTGWIDIDLSNLTALQGIRIPGQSVGGLVSGAGDVNNDGYDDFLIGGGGSSYLIFGNSFTNSPSSSPTSLPSFSPTDLPSVASTTELPSLASTGSPSSAAEALGIDTTLMIVAGAMAFMQLGDI